MGLGWSFDSIYKTFFCFQDEIKYLYTIYRTGQCTASTQCGKYLWRKWEKGGRAKCFKLLAQTEERYWWAQQ